MPECCGNRMNIKPFDADHTKCGVCGEVHKIFK